MMREYYMFSHVGKEPKKQEWKQDEELFFLK